MLPFWIQRDSGNTKMSFEHESWPASAQLSLAQREHDIWTTLKKTRLNILSTSQISISPLHLVLIEVGSHTCLTMKKILKLSHHIQVWHDLQRIAFTSQNISDQVVTLDTRLSKNFSVTFLCDLSDFEKKIHRDCMDCIVTEVPYVCF